jgi:hypothetical protein
MPVPTGTATPWREVENPGQGPGFITYLRPGPAAGTADLLGEALRADGIFQGFGQALGAAADARLAAGWYGPTEDGEDALCSMDGWTADGSEVPEPVPCVMAVINLEVDR